MFVKILEVFGVRRGGGAASLQADAVPFGGCCKL